MHTKQGVKFVNKTSQKQDSQPARQSQSQSQSQSRFPSSLARITAWAER
jgi:hypothetical protein